MATNAIFISHSSQDRVEATAIAEWLKQEGHEGYFLDFDPDQGLTAGTRWEDELYRRLRLCRAAIAVVTPNWVQSKWCFAEIALARSEGKPVFFVKVAACDTSAIFSDTQAVDATANPQAAYRLMARSLRDVGIDPEETFALDPSRSVYPGLSPYSEDDAVIFFGRGQEIQSGLEHLEILRKPGRPKLLLLLGASGSGKSSLMRAGLLPRLSRKPRSQFWLPIAAFEPGSDPFQELATRLARAFEKANGQMRDRDAILARIRPAPFDPAAAGGGLLELAQDLRFAAKLDDATVLLAIDQAEQLFRSAAADAEEGAGKIAREFVQCLRHALAAADRQIMAIATMRSDLLDRFQTHPDVQDLPFESLMIAAVQPRHLPEVIEGPANLAGIKLEPGLVSTIVQDARTGDALPLLAFTLQQLYRLRERRGRDDSPLTIRNYLEEIGGLEGSVRIVADGVLEAAKPSIAQLSALRRAFVPGLVDITEDGAYTGIRAPWNSLPEDAHGLLEEFVSARLLVSDEAEGQRVVRIAHDALIRNWPFLEGQVKAAQRFLETRRRIEQAARQWESDKDESRLLRGGRPLAEAEEILAAHPQDLSDRLVEYINLSQAKVTNELAEAKRQRDTAQANYLVSAAQLKAAADPTLAIRLAEAALQLRESAHARQIAMQIYSQNMFSRTVASAADWIRALAFCPDGQSIVTGSDDGVVDLWDLQGNRVRTLWRTGDPIHGVAAYPAGKFIAIASGRVVDVIDYSGRRLFVLAGHEDAVTCVTVSRDSTAILTGSTDHTARLWGHGGKLLKVFALDEGSSVWSVEFAPNGQFVLLGDTVRVFLRDLNGEDKATFPLFSEFFVKARWAPDGKAILCSDGRLFSLSDGSSIKLEGSATESIAFSPRGDTIVTGGRNGTAVFWDRAGKKLNSLSNDASSAISHLAFSPDSRWLATVQGKTVDLWELWVAPLRIFGEAQGAEIFKKEAMSGGDLIQRMKTGEMVSTRSLAVSPTADTFVAATGHGGVLWDFAGRPLQALEGHSDVVWIAIFSPDGERIVTGSEDKSARIWDKDGVFQFVLPHEAGVTAALFSPDSQMVATGSRDGAVRLWTAGGDLLKLIPGDGNAIAAVAFFQGRPLLLACTERQARILDFDGRAVQTFEYGHATDDAILASDGKSIMTRTWKDHLISRLDLETGSVATFVDTKWAVDEIAISPGNRIIAASDINGLVRFWDSAGSELRSIQREFRAYSLAFSRDGNFVLVGLETGNVELWPCPKTLEAFLEGGFAQPLSEENKLAYNIVDRPGQSSAAGAGAAE